MPVCEKCGLPKELCVCRAMDIEQQKIRVYLDQRRFGKNMTIIEGIGNEEMGDLVKKLKSTLACGGTSKKGRIELQGNHKAKARDLLIRFGFDSSRIEVR